MARPRNGRCRQCHRPLPPENSRDDLTASTDTCQRCASVKLAAAYRRGGPGDAWLKVWQERLRRAMDLHRT